MSCTNTLLLFQSPAFVFGASTLLLTRAKTYAAFVVYCTLFSVANGILTTTFIIECMHVESVEESKEGLL